LKSKKNNLVINILVYLIGLSVLILVFLWFFQIIFLNNYYKINQTNTLKNSLEILVSNYNKENYEKIYNDVAIENGICFNIIKDNKNIYPSYHSNHCIGPTNQTLTEVEKKFINSKKKTDTYEMINPNYNNKILLYARKIDKDTYIFANTSLEPLDSSIKLLKSQFLYVALVVLILSALVSIFISNKISKPIIELNKKVKKLRTRDYKITFDESTDILELKELAVSLNNTVKELAKSEEVKREIMANVSHDLKTPLTMIKAYAESARDLNSNKKEKREADLNIIIEETERLNILVNDILDLSKFQSNNVSIHKEKFNITELIKSITKRFEIYTEKDYQLEFKEEKAYYIYADKKRIEQVIYNLINNAINYAGEDKKIIIKYKKERNTLRVNITDHGVGIEEAELDLIWDKYYKTNKQYSRTNIGTGLGLSIVKEILMKHNYKYGVTSKKGKGTTFYFEATIVKK